MGKGDLAGRMVRLEAAALLALIVVVYGQRDASWLLFAALFLAPDVSALGYLVSPRAGAIGYNLGHTLVFPVVLGLAGLVAGAPLLVTLALIWAAHITFDRTIGYGFKNLSDSWDSSSSPSRSAGDDLPVSMVAGTGSKRLKASTDSP